MKIIYLGTPDFATLPLKAIFESGLYEIVGVITNKDKPVGRKQVMTPPPVKVLAQSYNLPVFQYDKIRIEGLEDIKKLNPDLMITCAFGQILSKEILDIPKLGVINIHASLLPKYRGASPIHYAILNGEEETGITIMQTDIGIDTGDIILQKSIKINKNETCGQLFERLSDLGARCVLEAIDLIASCKAEYIKQNEAIASYSKIINKQDALISWSDDATTNFNKIRAFNPAPVAYCMLDDFPFKIYEAEVVDLNGREGEILCCEDKLIIGCKTQSLSLLKVQKSGGKPMGIKDFLRGNKFIQHKDFC